MNLRHWRHFLAIAELRSLTRAAERTGVPQPVLSREMRELEQGFGTALLARHARGVALTAAGEAFRRRAETILREIDRVPADVAAGSALAAGRLSLGTPPSMAALLTGELIARYRRRWPQIQLHLREATSIGIRDGLIARELDLGILSTPLIEPQLALTPLIEEPMVLVGPPDGDLDPGRPVTIAEVAARPLILATRPNSTRLLLEHAMESIGLAPVMAMEIDNAPIGELVRHGCGHAVLPSSFVAAQRHAPLRHAPIVGLWMAWMIGSLRDLPLTAAAERMVAEIHGVIADRPDWALWTDPHLRQSLRAAPASTGAMRPPPRRAGARAASRRPRS
jgi:LysR family nitrogen assimilation transcriptional regulator